MFTACSSTMWRPFEPFSPCYGKYIWLFQIMPYETHDGHYNLEENLTTFLVERAVKKDPEYDRFVSDLTGRWMYDSYVGPLVHRALITACKEIIAVEALMAL